MWGLVYGAVMLASSAVRLHTTLRGEFVVWSELLDGLGLRRDESVLDVGCGRGAVLMMVAQRLDSGRGHDGDAVRVLRPGGRLVPVDFRHTRDYQRDLAECGVSGLRRQGLGRRFWYGGPWAATTMVTGTKPGPTSG